MRSGRAVAVLDQAVSSLSNVGMTVVAAHSLSRRGLGAFAVAFAFYAVVLGVGRALTTEPLLVRARGGSDADGGKAAAAMTAVGLAGGVLAAAGALAVGGPAGSALLVLAPFLPLLALQDAWRYAGFASERPERALFVDAVWVAAQVFGVVWLVGVHARNPAAYVAAWGAAGSLAAVAGAVRTRIPVRRNDALPWVRAQFDLGWPFVGDFVVAGGATSANLWALGAISGLGAVGAVKVAQTLLGPINILHFGMYVMLIPQGAREAVNGPAPLRRAMARASFTLAGLAVAWTACAAALPAHWDRALFGQTAATARPIVVPFGLAVAAGGIAIGANAGLRAIAEARVALRVRIVTLPLVLVPPIVGALVGDEMGFTIAFAAASWVSAGLWWAAFLRTAPRAAVAATPPQPITQ